MLAVVQKLLLMLGALMGFVSVCAGAFGAHALKERLSTDMLAAFEVGARYQMYHAFAIFAAVWISTLIPGKLPSSAGWLFFSGSLIFSGSLYLLAMTGLRFLGAITPIGGLILLSGWLCLAIATLAKLR
jgi:uncharacterized membrane protein YgdD (TMEM256/DUF423 family)